jgi:type IV pilus assembly protein PilX
VKRRVDARPAQRGATLVIVLFLLAAMVLGALLYARAGLTHTLLAHNTARNEAAAQASDVGIATAFAELTDLPDDNADRGGWYFAVRGSDDADGLPSTIDWTAAHELRVGAYSTRYVVERQCTAAIVSDELNQCLLSENPLEIRNAGDTPIAPPSLRTYRVTVRVTGPKNTVSWTQALLSRR